MWPHDQQTAIYKQQQQKQQNKQWAAAETTATVTKNDLYNKRDQYYNKKMGNHDFYPATWLKKINK